LLCRAQNTLLTMTFIDFVKGVTGETIILDVSFLLMSYDDNGHPVYKAKGGQYQKFGVRVWPEILPALGVDPSSLTCACGGSGAGKPGPNPVNLKVNVLMGENGPRKVISLAQ
jgi:hypothetical protein